MTVRDFILDVFFEWLLPKSYIDRKVQKARERELFQMEQAREKKELFDQMANILKYDAPLTPSDFRSALRFVEGMKDRNAIKVAIKAIAKRRESHLITAIMLGRNGNDYSTGYHSIPSGCNNPYSDAIPPFGLDREKPLPDYISDVYQNCKVKEKVVVKLGKDPVWPWPWNSGRLQRAFGDFGSINGEPWKQDHNHRISFWRPLDISWVGCGNHSISSGIVQSEGEIELDHYYDISPLYDLIKTDGYNWIDKMDDTILAPVADIHFAIIFEMGRHLVESFEPRS